MLDLMAVRMNDKAAPRRAQLGVDDDALARSREIWQRSLEGGRILTRDAMMAALDDGGVPSANQRGYHILAHLAQEGLICFGPPQGKQQTFVLLDEWLPGARRLARDEALAELARRYYTGHGPATVHDLVWWSGLTVGEVREAIALAGSALVKETVGKTAYWTGEGAPGPVEGSPASSVHLLPGFDEYLLGYKERSAMLDPQHVERTHPGSNGVFRPVLVVDGRVAGTWQRTLRKKGVRLAVTPFAPLDDAVRPALAAAAARYSH
jgi:hypothetical protein